MTILEALRTVTTSIKTWVEGKFPIKDNVYMLESKNMLAKGEDLNDPKFLVCGQWTCGSGSTALTLLNTPVNAAFKLTTEQMVLEYNLLQTVTPYYYYDGSAGTRAFKFMRTIRSTDDGVTWTFGEWDGAVSTGAFEHAVKKTGDTMVGDLYIDSISCPTVGLYSPANSDGKKAYGCIYKNANATNDYGLQLRDYSYGEFDTNNSSALFIANKYELTNKLLLSVVADGVTTLYKIYGEHNKPTPADIGVYTKDEVKALIANSNNALPKIATICLHTANWIEGSGLFSQVVTISGTTVNSKIDLQPTAQQVLSLQNEEIALMAENSDGIITVYAIGGIPSSDYEMQVLITEVYAI